jgi:2,6-dihydroxypyridine 3-monooxygenase
VVATGRVAVVGGSLGGLTSALLLRDAGFDVTIYERSGAELEQRGAGIGFLPDASRYLSERAGVDLDDISISTDYIRYFNRDGSIAHDIEHRYRLSSWNTVYRALLKCFGADRYLLGREIVGRTEHADSVTVHFSDGADTEVDLLVCADGITSQFRAELVPKATRNYSGYVGWRGMVPESQLDPSVIGQLGDALSYFVYANSHILVYPIPGLDGSVERGGRLINFVWYRNYLQGGDLDDLLTDAGGAHRDVSIPPGLVSAHHVDEMRATALARLPKVLADAVIAVARPFLQVVYDVEVNSMAFGRTCLVGDAGWVARPHAAAGTAKAAADGWALADALSHAPSIPDALVVFERKQLALGRQLVDRTRRIGTHSQVTNTWDPRNPEMIFGLREPGR